MTHQLRILIIDDEPAVVSGMKFRVESKGYEAVAAYDGESGLAAARRESPDLILLDRRLPDSDGLEVLAALKQFDETNRIPVVMISGNQSDCQEAIEAGAAAFLSKPYRGEDFLHVITTLTNDQIGTGV